MTFAADQIDELRLLCESIDTATEGGVAYLLLRGLRRSGGDDPAVLDVLLCPTPRDGYPWRLFFTERLATRTPQNWNGSIRILERDWHAFSRKSPTGLRLAQMVAMQLMWLQ